MTNKRVIPNQLHVSQIDQDEIVTWEAGRKTKKLIKLCQVYMHIKNLFNRDSFRQCCSNKAAVMNLHYKVALKMYDGCPIPLSFGESKMGKSSLVKGAPLLLMGRDNIGFFKKTTLQVWFRESFCNDSL